MELPLKADDAPNAFEPNAGVVVVPKAGGAVVVVVPNVADVDPNAGATVPKFGAVPP